MTSVDAPSAPVRTPDPLISAIQNVRSMLRGQVIEPGDPDYDTARKVYNAMIDRRPRLIVRCANVGDVMTGVNFARDNDLLLAIRGGGHNGPGLGTCDDGLVLDLGLMNSVHVDPVKRTARVFGGATLGDIDHATHAFGLVLPTGIISTTGIGGIALGGGLGHLSRKLGLALDNLLEADLVLADGSFVTASPTEHPDLFWAIRGGGGNFGVVTSFLFTLHPLSMVYGGPMFWPIEQAADVMRFWRDTIDNAPEELNGFFAFAAVPPVAPFPEHLHGQTVAAVIWCYAGDLNQAEAIFEPIRAFGPPIVDFVGALPVPALQSMFDGLYPPGFQWYWKADFVDELTEEAIALHVKHGEQLPTRFSTMHLYPIDGAVARVDPQATAFSYRGSRYAEVMVGVDPDPANAQRITEWARAYWNDLHPHSAGGAYINMMMEEGQDRVQAAYRDNYPRLAEIKARYDPTNLFRYNQNIKPAT